MRGTLSINSSNHRKIFKIPLSGDQLLHQGSDKIQQTKKPYLKKKNENSKVRKKN